MADRTCSIDGCERKHKGHGLCQFHLRRRDSGAPLDAPPRPSWAGESCTAEGCSAKIVAKGLCSMHWQRQKHGRPIGEPAKVRNLGQACTVEGCNTPSRKRGWCATHYERWHKHGDPSIVRTPIKGTCAVAGCEREHYAHGMCLPHSRRAAAGKPLDKPFRPFRAGSCSADDCDEPGRHRGLCRRHRQRQDYRDDPEPFKAKVAARRQRVGELDERDREITAEYRRAIANDPCAYCGAAEAGHVDHYFPIALGGTDHWFNLVKACQRCNLRKWAHCGTRFALKHGGIRESGGAPALP